jgi:hypothetical protein
MTRRQFLYHGSAAIAVMTVFPAIVSGKSANAADNFCSLDRISYSQLAAQINTAFRVHAPSGRIVELRLLKAPLDAPSPVVPGRRLLGDFGNEKFSLIFTGRRDESLQDAIHFFEHDQLGRFDMYIGQIGARNLEQIRYQSIFNRPVSRTPV